MAGKDDAVRSMTDRLVEETNNRKIGGWLKGAFAPVIRAVDQQVEATKALARFMEKNARQNKNSVDILQDNMKLIKELAEKGDHNAQALLDSMDKELDHTKKVINSIEAGGKVSHADATAAAKSLAKMVGLAELTNSKFEIGLGRILELNRKTAADETLWEEDRKKAMLGTIEALKAVRKDLSHNGKQLLDKLVSMDVANMKLTEENLNLFYGVSDELQKVSSVTKKVVAASLQEIDKKLGDGLTQAGEIAKAEKKQHDAEKKKPGFYDKSGLQGLVQQNKAGFADAILGQLGLGGIGLGRFITDSERLKNMWEGLVESGYKFKNFLAGIPTNIKESITSLTNFAKGTVGKIKQVSITAWAGLANFGNKLKTTGVETLDLLKKQTKGLKDYTKTLFSRIGEGFGKFWKDGLKLMQKGSGFLGMIGSAIMSGLSAAFSAILGGGRLAGGALLGGAKMLGRGALGAGKLLGRGAGGLLRGGGKLLGGMGKLGAKGLGALLKGGGKFLGPLGLAITAGMAGFDFYDGYNNANDIAGVGKDAKLGTGKKIQAGLSGMLSGLTFGMVDPKTIFQGIQKGLDYMFGKDGILTKTADFFKRAYSAISLDSIKGLFSTVTTAIGNFFNAGAIKESISKAIESAKGIFTNDSLLEGVKSFITSLFDAVKTVIMNMVPGGQLASSAVEYFKNWFAGGATPTINGVVAPAQQQAAPVPTGNLPTVDTAATKSLATADLTAPMSSRSAQAIAPPPVVSSGGEGGGGSKGGYRPAYVDDLSLATLNSIIFE